MTDEPDWSNWVLEVEGAIVDDDGMYRCEGCDEVLFATGEVDRSGDVPESTFECPECGEGYPIPASGPRPRSIDLPDVDVWTDEN